MYELITADSWYIKKTDKWIIYTDYILYYIIYKQGGMLLFKKANGRKQVVIKSMVKNNDYVVHMPG